MIFACADIERILQLEMLITANFDKSSRVHYIILCISDNNQL